MRQMDSAVARCGTVALALALALALTAPTVEALALALWHRHRNEKIDFTGFHIKQHISYPLIRW